MKIDNPKIYITSNKEIVFLGSTNLAMNPSGTIVCLRNTIHFIIRENDMYITLQEKGSPAFVTPKTLYLYKKEEEKI